jgi:hypothetical protein
MNCVGPIANDTLSVVVVLLMPGEPPGLMLASFIQIIQLKGVRKNLGRPESRPRRPPS